MPWIDALYPWLIHSALMSLAVLAVGSMAVVLCRQPARRVRIIELSLAGCLVAPWLGMIPGYPQLAVGRWYEAFFDRHERTPPPSAERPIGQTARRIVPLGDSIGANTFLPFPKTGEGRSGFRFTWNAWIVGLYAFGVALGAAWWLAGIAGLARIVWTAREAPPRCRELLREIAGRRGERVRLIVSRYPNQPLAAAWGRPVIVLPENLCGDERSLRWCLAHEWTHVERDDFRAWLLAGLVRVLFFYQPLVWWLRRQLRLCQDFVADARAAGQASQPEDYAEFLTVRAAAGSLHPAIVGLGMGFRKSELYRRIVMLVQNHPIESRTPRLWSVSATLAALVLIAAVASLGREPQAVAQGQSGKSIESIDKAKETSTAVKDETKNKTTEVKKDKSTKATYQEEKPSAEEKKPPKPPVKPSKQDAANLWGDVEKPSAERTRPRPQTTLSAAVSPVENESTEKIKKALVSPTQMHFKDAPLRDVVDYLRDYHEIEIQLDKKALEDVGIGSDTPITVNLKSVSLRTALRLLLKEHGMTYIIQGGVLLITSPDGAQDHLETCVYLVGDLVLPPNSTEETQLDQGFDTLINVIKSTVKPTTWDSSGGAGSIVPFWNNLSIVVSQSQDVLEGVDLLLEKLRAASREQVKEGQPAFKPRPKSKSDAERHPDAGGEKKR